MFGRFKLFGFLFLLVFVAVVIWNIMLFQDCRSHGQPMYRCAAAIQNPNYVWVDGQ